MNALLQDIRFGARMLAKSPGFTAAALTTLALGIGVNTAMFSIINAMQKTPQRFADSDELVFLWRHTERYEHGSISALDYFDLREQAQSFADIGVYVRSPMVLTGNGDPDRVNAVRTSANLLPMLGFDAQLGRLYTAEEDSPGGERVAVLTDRLWQRRYDRDAGILGETVSLNDRPHTIIGVLPPKVDFETFWREADIVTPLRIDPAAEKRENRGCSVIARLRPGVTAEQAQTEASGIAARFAEAYPETNADMDLRVQPLIDYFTSPSDRLASLVLLAAVGLVLLIACANLANLLLAKATSRGREFAVRTALGAGRARIARQLLTESLLVALLGGALGLLVGAWAVDIFVASMEYLPFLEEEIGLNPSVLIYTLLLSCAAALAFGLAPALLASKVSLSEALKEGTGSASAGHSRNRLRNALVVAQLAIALPLLICCGLVNRHLGAIKSRDLGFNTTNLIIMEVDLPHYRYTQDVQRAAFYRDAIATVETMPGIEAAGAAQSMPIYGAGWGMWAAITPEERITDDPARQQPGPYQTVTPGYFRTMEIALLRGRFFTDSDHADAEPVGIINHRMAKQFWPGEDALGKRLTLDAQASPVQWITVVGVVADAGCGIYGESPDPELYLPHAQQPSGGMIVVARTAGDPMKAVTTVRSAIHGLDADVPVHGFRTVADLVHRWLRDDRMAAGFLGGLAILALSLASVGLYGVMSYSVAQRIHEIGVRVALGAGRRDVMRLVLRRCVTLAGIGIVIGMVCSVPLGFALEAHLYGVSGTDPVTLLGVAALLFGVALLAGYVPARRATKVDPMAALRCE